MRARLLSTLVPCALAALAALAHAPASSAGGALLLWTGERPATPRVLLVADALLDRMLGPHALSARQLGRHVRERVQDLRRRAEERAKRLQERIADLDRRFGGGLLRRR